MSLKFQIGEPTAPIPAKLEIGATQYDELIHALDKQIVANKWLPFSITDITDLKKAKRQLNRRITALADVKELANCFWVFLDKSDKMHMKLYAIAGTRPKDKRGRPKKDKPKK